MLIRRIYKTPGLSKGHTETALTKIKKIADHCTILATESCFYIASNTELSEEEVTKLEWILSTPFQETSLKRESSFSESDESISIEIGPRLNFSTPFSTNAVSICQSVGLTSITRIEASVRYNMGFDGSRPSDVEEERIVQSLHDRMTQCRYKVPIDSFEMQTNPDQVYEVDITGQGKAALQKANKDLGLAFDDWDIDYYTNLFKDKIRRNPTSVECFDLAQSNSEHSRHWFFRGKLIIDGTEQEGSLFRMIMATQDSSNDNNVIKFNDNSSGIQGYDVMVYKPSNPSEPSQIKEVAKETRHIIFTAETHNFPTGVAPFPGATTGTGGRIRDVHCTGQGAHVVAGTAGYSFGNLNIPGYKLPWEDEDFEYPPNFASPLDIAIEASNGASDYGNKFGEPVLAGFARSFGMDIGAGDRREYIKPIMFSGGVGQLEGSHVLKDIPKKGMEVTKVGGPVYRIGVGGGAASSVQVQGDNKSELDFGAVQRGDAEMEQKLNRLIRACVEMGEQNPIASIHDQGAGGNGNVLKELVEPAGAVIRASDFQLGDPTLSILELWGAEYQETNAMLIEQGSRQILEKIGKRERCPVSFVGTVTGDGKICLENFKNKKSKRPMSDSPSQSTKRVKSEETNGIQPMVEGDAASTEVTNENGCDISEQELTNGKPDTTRVDETGDNTRYPVDLDLEYVLGKMPQKEFHLDHVGVELKPLSLPENLAVQDALNRVLRLPSVASKRYLTNKVDRCVTGLVAQQQCVGPLHTPLSDVAVTALSYLEKKGSATAIGEQPVKGLIDPAFGARMAVAEALTNLVFAKVSNLKDVKCSGNWMWPAKLPGEGAALVDACRAMCDLMSALGIAVDGGKDSLSMAARVGQYTVKAPGTLVISAYVGCPDISLTITPDLKCPNGKGSLLHVDIGKGKTRLGGSALAQCYKQLGKQVPDLDYPEALSAAFNVTQKLISEKKLMAGHDISDGGLITCLLEMAFAGNCGINVDLSKIQDSDVISQLFAEEAGLVLEVPEQEVASIKEMYNAENIPCHLIGHSLKNEGNPLVKISVEGSMVLEDDMTVLRDVWEETSFTLELHQTSPICVAQERDGMKSRRDPPYKLTFDPDIIHIIPKGKAVPIVAVLREEGSNSDREMSAALLMAGFEVWDVNMQDLCAGSITLDRFHGLVFVGGFSYADVLGSAKGWAATARFNQTIRDQFRAFYDRPDTFSLGVCNGCQLMGLLGWVAPYTDEGSLEPSQGVFLDHNDSERFECRFSTVRVYDSPAIMFRGMEGSIFGMWTAHGEGKMVFKSPEIFNRVETDKLIPVRYVDDEGEPTVIYPHNPNGSPAGVAALCSQDGRHLAIMPHPERCFLPWQCPWIPEDMKNILDASPWMKMFQNAFDWSITKNQCLKPPT